MMWGEADRRRVRRHDMTRTPRPRGWRPPALLLALGLAMAAAGSPAARRDAAAAAPPAVDLVVDRGDGGIHVERLPWVEGMTGLTLLSGSSVPVVANGGAVCAIDGLGCPAADCFCACKGARGCRYWSYHHGDAAGAWSAAGTGPAEFQVPAGALEGWAWGRPAPLAAPAPWRSGRLALAWLRRFQDGRGGMAGHVGFSAEAAFGARGLGLDLDLLRPSAAGPGLREFMLAAAADYARSVAATGKAVAGLAAAGGDPRRAAGADLVARLAAAYDPTSGRYGSGTWDQAWAILGLVAAGEALPPAAVGALLGLADPAGGWSADGAGEPEADSTGLALQAAHAAGLPPDAPVLRAALDFLAAGQGADGGWGHHGPSNVNSTAYATAGILATGENPRGGRWAAGHPSPIDFLLAAQTADGRLRFGNADAEESDLVASLQALPALAGRPLPPAGAATALRRALDWLRAQQQPDGGFGGFGPGSSLDAVLALAGAGQDPAPRHRAGRTARDYLVATGPDYAERGLAAAGKLAAGLRVLDVDADALPRGEGRFDLRAHLTLKAAEAVGAREQSVWDLAWAILGLTALNVPLPDGLAQDLADAGSPGGGWGYARGAEAADPDSTGLALSALAAAGWGRDRPAVQEAEAWLLSAQQPSGGWGFEGAPSVDATAGVLLGLSAQGHRVDGAGWMGGEPGGWSRRSGRDAIMGLQATDGSFQGPSPLLATTAGIQALAGRPWPWLGTGRWRLWLPLLTQRR
jgi:prenyltransferase beta subunit